MTTTTSPVVLLIPGIFGFNAFGPEDEPILEYFAGVKPILERALPPDYVVVAHEPPPTGSLDERVASLHDAVRKLMKGERLPHGPRGLTAQRVHLVGHSTGGLDARLLANPKFFWTGGPRGTERTDLLGALGEIVTLSAPFRGTPLVRSVGAVRDAALALVTDLTLLGIFANSGVDAFFLRWLVGAAGVLGPTSLSQLPSGLVSRLGRVAARRRKASPNDAALVAHQVERFLLKLHDDRQLYDDLSVDNMERINGDVAGGDDLARIHSYVTVSPSPPSIDIGREMLGRLVYRYLYPRTARGPLAGPQPGTAAATIGPLAEIQELLESQVSCDGVVPTRSQTLATGAGAVVAAERIVLADHLDIVGSFRGGPGADVMRSDSNFTRAEFQELWVDVAGCIAPR